MIQSSGLKGASAVICNVPCNYWGCKLVADTGKTPLLTIYDSNNSTTTGKVEVGYEKSSDTLTMGGQVLSRPVRCFNGIYANITADAGSYIVYYEVI